MGGQGGIVRYEREGGGRGEGKCQEEGVVLK